MKNVVLVRLLNRRFSYLVRLRTPLRITHGAAVLEFQILLIRPHIQDVSLRWIGLGCAGWLRTCDRFEMWQRRIQLGILIQR